MTDDVHFGELRGSLAYPENNSPVQPENNLSLGHDDNVQDPHVQDSDVQDRNVPVRHHGQKAVTEMIIGPWYLDEFGNPTREIKARD